MIIHTGNVFDTVSNIGSSATTAALVVGGLLAIVFIILIAWKSGGAIGAVITGMISAALFVWALNNITDSGCRTRSATPSPTEPPPRGTRRRGPEAPLLR